MELFGYVQHTKIISVFQEGNLLANKLVKCNEAQSMLGIQTGGGT